MSDQITPMMKQYNDIKSQYPDAYLFFRLGDFYELFGSDAYEASSILDITLTKRHDIPMCGVPYHAVDLYIAKMVKAGKKIAICDQMEDPKLAKGIVKREVREVITPGTLVDENILLNKSNNYLLALNQKGLYIEIAYLDLSTGDFEINEIEYSSNQSILNSELTRINPKELIIPEDIWQGDKNIRDLFNEYENIPVNRFPRWHFENEENRKIVLKHFNIKSIEELVLKVPKTDLTTVGVILKYVLDNSRSLLSHIQKVNYYNYEETMLLDESTLRNLELLKNMRDDSSVNTLLEILDKTVTSMGARLLKKWIASPLINLEKIKKRQSRVNFFYINQDLLNKLDKELKNIMDLERLAARIVLDKATPKDLVSIKLSIKSCANIYRLLKYHNEFVELMAKYSDLLPLAETIDKAIKDEPATLINDGNIVRDGYNKSLDELKDISLKSKEYISRIEAGIKEKFSVSTLKVKYNKILGYFFEVSKLQAKNLDNTFILKQSLVNTHRYTTKELSEYESKVLIARDEINRIEEEIFNEIKNNVLEKISNIQNNAKIISEIDIYSSFAKVAFNNNYVCPDVNESSKIIIKEARHPVIEQKLAEIDFIPNNLEMDLDSNYVFIITGPNMSGKSTYLRQNALIILMAQIGSFVPASSASIGIVDRIFTRIGSTDNLARGQSTFLVEMLETANILKYATKKSFIIMDEIGRGTSTFDGLSIAWSVLEYIHNKKMLGAKTLFATHYHELTDLEKKSGIKNFSIAISEENGKITFLHKIIPGPAEKSYGIHVAGLANLPEEVIYYAQGLLKKLEDNKNHEKITIETNDRQLELFDLTNIKEKKKRDEIIESLKSIDLNRLTPIDALNVISDIQKKLKK